MTEDTTRGLNPSTSDPFLHVAITEAARLACTTPDAWIQTRMRACLSVELSDQLGPLSKAALTDIHRWVAGNAPLHHQSLPSAEDMCARMAGTTEVAKPKTQPGVSTHRLYDPAALEQATARIADKDQRVQFQALAKRGPTRVRPVVTMANERRVRQLLTDAPHLSEASQAVLNAIIVARRAKASIRLAPLLLSGPPASGKTWWARQIADALDLPSTVFVMPKVTASFVLSGSAPSWSAARAGRIVEAFARSDVASPLIVLDEVEKASTGNYDPAPVLLDLLDVDSAARWQDEFYGIEFDISSAIIVATCNDPALLDPALRSRFREIRVRTPGKDALPAIIRSAWTAHRRLYPDLRLPAELPQPSVDYLTNRKPDMRELQRRFDDAIARAAQRPGRIRLIPADLGAPAVALAPEERIVRRYLVLDLEATCDDQGRVPRGEMEIIEIGAVLLEPYTWEIVEEFNAFVRPVRHPRLTPFCTQLTSIEQSDVDGASGFVEVVRLFQAWLRSARLTAWGSWGNYDRRQIQQDCDYHGIEYPIEKAHVNLKDRFAKRFDLIQRPGLSKALQIAGIDFVGTHHRAIDDARNIARLMHMLYPTRR